MLANADASGGEYSNRLLCNAQDGDEAAHQTWCGKGVIYHAVHQEADGKAQNSETHPEGGTISIAHQFECVFESLEPDHCHDRQGDDAALQQNLQDDVVRMGEGETGPLKQSPCGVGAGTVSEQRPL